MNGEKRVLIIAEPARPRSRFNQRYKPLVDAWALYDNWVSPTGRSAV